MCHALAALERCCKNDFYSVQYFNITIKKESRGLTRDNVALNINRRISYCYLAESSLSSLFSSLSKFILSLLLCIKKFNFILRLPVYQQARSNC